MKSIRAQLTLRLLVGGTLLLGAAGTALQWQVRRALTAGFDATLRATAQSLASLTEQKHGQVKLEFAGDNMPQFERENGPDVFLLRTAEGHEIERSHSLGTITLPLRADSPESPVIYNATLPDGRVIRCAGLRFTPPDEDAEPAKNHRGPKVQALLVVGRDRAPLDHTLAALRASLLLVGAGTLAVLAALVRWGVRGGLAPRARRGESVAAVDAASLATRFSAGPLPAELRPIATRLNELLARLESAFARERRFTATAAHELRTPLAELRALAEVNLTTPATEIERTQSWRDTLAATLRMESLALRLLELARAEDPARVLHRQPVALAAAFANAWQPWAARAAGRGILLTTTLPTGFSVHTDPELLGVILGNLCANAAEHAPAGTPLRITATRTTCMVTLHFQNHAGDLTAADVPHLFERFWRKDTARADARHHGLGLALAAECATLLGAILTARLGTGGELEFSIQLPNGANSPAPLMSAAPESPAPTGPDRVTGRSFPG